MWYVYYIIIAVGVLIIIGLKAFLIRWVLRRNYGSIDKKNEISIKGKIVVVTGASAGIGEATALEFAQREANVILACRNLSKAETTVKWIRSKTYLGQLTCMKLDLASLNSVRKFAKEFNSKYDKLDILVNNAGVSFDPRERQKTVDGFEMHMGVNHLGHFLLTNLLLEPLKRAAPSRVVTVSSTLHSWDGSMDFNDLMGDKRVITTGPFNNPLYNKSKLANALFSQELAKRLQGTGVKTYALCPGLVDSDLAANLKFPWSFFITLLRPPLKFFVLKSVQEGASTTVYCALNKDLESESGTMYQNCGPWPASKRIALTEEDARKLWDESTRLVKAYLYTEP